MPELPAQVQKLIKLGEGVRAVCGKENEEKNEEKEDKEMKEKNEGGKEKSGQESVMEMRIEELKKRADAAKN